MPGVDQTGKMTAINEDDADPLQGGVATDERDARNDEVTTHSARPVTAARTRKPIARSCHARSR